MSGNRAHAEQEMMTVFPGVHSASIFHMCRLGNVEMSKFCLKLEVAHVISSTSRTVNSARNITAENTQRIAKDHEQLPLPKVAARAAHLRLRACAVSRQDHRHFGA